MQRTEHEAPVVLTPASRARSPERRYASGWAEARATTIHRGDPCFSVVPRRPGPTRVVARSRNTLVFLEPHEVWAFEAADRLTFVHSAHGRFDVDLSLAKLQGSWGQPLMRVHRNWLVSLEFVKAMEREGGETALLVGTAVGSGRIRVPVSRHCAKAVRAVLLHDATGIRAP
jgi:DNA-binding LytR/AlgR family response regulator